MGDRIKIAGDEFTSVSVRYDDIFSMKELYKFVREFLVMRGYLSPTAGYEEKYYMEKIDQTNAKEIWAWWRMDKVPRESPYFKYHLKVDFHVMGLRDVEATIRGQKVKANKGEVEVMINAELETDVGSSLEKNQFIAPFFGIFKRKLYRRQVGNEIGLLSRDVNDLVQSIKQYLELKPFVSGMETFHPPKGL